MRRPFFSLTLVSLSLCAFTQPRPPSKNDGAVIQYVKNLSAASFDSRLPRVSLEYFLEYETEGAPAKWTIGGCGEPSTSRNADPGLNSPICVHADFDLDNGSTLTILIQVEGSQRQKSPDSFVVSLSITELTGSVRQIRSLGDLPMELHRWPAKTPKDLPAPGRDS
jgi:hypothetical protein